MLVIGNVRSLIDVFANNTKVGIGIVVDNNIVKAFVVPSNPEKGIRVDFSVVFSVACRTGLPEVNV